MKKDRETYLKFKPMADDLRQAESWCDLDGVLNRTETMQNLYKMGYRKQKVGHWFILEYEYFTCSECGYDHYNGCEYTLMAKERLANGDVPNFCPNCGAKMKGD